MGSGKKISVVVPVYNVEKYLRECLDSIVNQTLMDIEIICVNDGSTDGSLKILEEYASKDDRIIIINQENQGLGITRNRAIDIAQGEYLAFVDSDDFIELNAFEILYNKFKETDADVIQFDYSTHNDNGKPSEKRSIYELLKRDLGYELKDNSIFKWSDLNAKKLTQLRMYCWDKIYKTKFIKDNNIRFSMSRFCEDHLFSISLYLLADKILYLNRYLYIYRIREGSITREPLKDIDCAFQNIELLKDFLIKHDFFEIYHEAYRKYLITMLRGQYLVISKEKTKKYLGRCAEILTSVEYKKLIKEIKPKFSIGEKIFSVTNQRINGKKCKTLCILGLKKSFIVR